VGRDPKLHALPTNLKTACQRIEKKDRSGQGVEKTDMSQVKVKKVDFHLSMPIRALRGSKGGSSVKTRRRTAKKEKGQVIHSTGAADSVSNMQQKRKQT